MKISLNALRFRSAVLALTTIISLSAVAAAQDAVHPNLKAIKIKNFGQMDDRFFRGGQPKETDYKDLAQLGIKTIIDLREDPEPYERPTAEALGMRYVNIPMIAKQYPTEQATETFLKIVNDPETGRFYVHCAGGRHRTGAMGAVYRYQYYDWTFDQVYKEMKQYDFYTSWGHGAFKDFVENYYADRQKLKLQTRSRTVTGTLQ